MTTQITEIILTGILFFGGVLFFLFMELLIPYRKSTVSKLKRWVNNLSLTAFNSAALTLLFSKAVIDTANHATTNQIGVMNMVQLPQWAKTLVIVIFLDFMLYIWHLLNHEVPFLSRFHRVHHTDLDMDVSTATRFHIGEIAISTVIKISLIYFIGADLLSLLVFESIVVLSAQFHHSSLRVPKWFETIYWIVFVPPSMHRIHHSVIKEERNSNYGVIFSLWDRMLGTLLTDVEQAGIRIGLNKYRDPARLHFHHLLVIPFRKSTK